MKNKKSRLILSICAIVMAAVVIACAIYVNDYYKGGDGPEGLELFTFPACPIKGSNALFSLC